MREWLCRENVVRQTVPDTWRSSREWPHQQWFTVWQLKHRQSITTRLAERSARWPEDISDTDEWSSVLRSDVWQIFMMSALPCTLYLMISTTRSQWKLYLNAPFSTDGPIIDEPPWLLCRLVAEVASRCDVIMTKPMVPHCSMICKSLSFVLIGLHCCWKK